MTNKILEYESRYLSRSGANKHTWLDDFIKRAFDLIVSLVVLILLAPFFGILALAIKKDSPGPVIYRGNRIGRGGKSFKILKFRTMYERAESYSGPRVTAQDDPRVTPLGHWLRNTKLNELPQFWNVLKGEMSLVGPRPEDPVFAKTWPTDAWREILSVRPGITSPASVLYRREEAILHSENVIQRYLQSLAPEKLRLDQLYVRYRSFWLDLDTLFLTALLMLLRLEAYSPPETILFLGPVSRIIRRYMSWLVKDLIIALAVFGVVALFIPGYLSQNVDVLHLLTLATSYALLFNLIGAAIGLNQINWSKANLRDVFDLLPAWGITSIGVFIANYMFFFYPLPALIGVLILSLVGFVLVRTESRLVSQSLVRIIHLRKQHKAVRERVLIVGSGRTAEQIAWILHHPTYSSRFKVVGCIDDDLMVQGMRIYGCKVIGTCLEIKKIIQQRDVGLIMLADHRLDRKECQAFANQYSSASIRVVVVPDIFGSVNDLLEHREPFTQVAIDQEMVISCRHCLIKEIEQAEQVS